MVMCLPVNLSILTVFLKNRNFISKIRRLKVTDYAVLKQDLSSDLENYANVSLMQSSFTIVFYNIAL